MGEAMFGQDVPPGDPPVCGAQRHRGLNKLEFADGQHLAPRQTRIGFPMRRADQKDKDQLCWFRRSRCPTSTIRRNGMESWKSTIIMMTRSVQPPRRPLRMPVTTPIDTADDHAEQSDSDAHPQGINAAAQDIAAELIRAEQMSRLAAQPGGGIIAFHHAGPVGIVRGHIRCENSRQGHEKHQDNAESGY